MTRVLVVHHDLDLAGQETDSLRRFGYDVVEWIADQPWSDGKVAIPVIWGSDAVHGHNNIVGATEFAGPTPTNEDFLVAVLWIKKISRKAGSKRQLRAVVVRQTVTSRTPGPLRLVEATAARCAEGVESHAVRTRVATTRKRLMQDSLCLIGARDWNRTSTL